MDTKKDITIENLIEWEIDIMPDLIYATRFKE